MLAEIKSGIYVGYHWRAIGHSANLLVSGPNALVVACWVPRRLVALSGCRFAEPLAFLAMIS